MLLQEVRARAPDVSWGAAGHVGEGAHRPQLRHVLLLHGEVQQQRPRVPQESLQVVIHDSCSEITNKKPQSNSIRSDLIVNFYSLPTFPGRPNELWLDNE